MRFLYSHNSFHLCKHEMPSKQYENVYCEKLDMIFKICTQINFLCFHESFKKKLICKRHHEMYHLPVVLVPK